MTFHQIALDSKRMRRYTCYDNTTVSAIIIAYITCNVKKIRKGIKKMAGMLKKWSILLLIAIAAFVLGRLAVRAFLNLLLGGTLFGGNFL